MDDADLGLALENKVLEQVFRLAPIPLHGEDGSVRGVIVALVDVTHLRRIKQELRQSEQRLRFHVENTTLAVAEWDAQFVVTRWSDQAERMFGWGSAETVGRRIFDLHLIDDEDVPIVEGVMRRLTDGVTRQVVSMNRNRTKDGRVLYCRWYNSVLLDEHGHMASVLPLVEDCTAGIQTEQLLRQAKESAEEANAAKRQFAETVPDERLEGRVLLAEDAVDTQEMLRIHLENAGLQVDIAADGLADDDTLVRTALRLMVDRLPEFEVVAEAGTGRKARERLPRLQTEIALMDIAMPDLDGPRVRHRATHPSHHPLRPRPPGDRVPGPAGGRRGLPAQGRRPRRTGTGPLGGGPRQDVLRGRGLPTLEFQSRHRVRLAMTGSSPSRPSCEQLLREMAELRVRLPEAWQERRLRVSVRIMRAPCAHGGLLMQFRLI